MRKSVAIALVDQAVLSLFNLGLNLAMIRFAAPQEFGRFILAAAAILILTSLQNALVATPLAILIPGRPTDEQAATAKTIVSADFFLRIAASAIAAVVCLLASHAADFLLAAALACFTTLSRETARSLALAHERTVECLRIDLVAVVGSIVATALLWRMLPPAVAALAGLALGNVLAVVTQRSTRVAIDYDLVATIDAYRQCYWTDTRWSLIGAGTTEVQYRSYVFALELFRDAAALASVQAGRLLLGPLPLVVGAWGRVARPAMARHLARGEPDRMIRLTAQGMVYVLVVAAIYCGVLYLAWPLAKQQFFQDKYPEVGAMTFAWAGYMVAVIAHMVLSVPLQAAMRLRELAQVTMVTAVLSCLLLTVLIAPVHAVWAVFVLTATEIVALIWIMLLVWRLSRAGIEAGHAKVEARVT